MIFSARKPTTLVVGRNCGKPFLFVKLIFFGNIQKMLQKYIRDTKNLTFSAQTPIYIVNTHEYGNLQHRTPSDGGDLCLLAKDT